MYSLSRRRFSMRWGATFLPFARHENVLLAVGDIEVAMFVQIADIARVEPAVGIDGCRSRFGLFIVGPS
jgi:hypothetical protein